MPPPVPPPLPASTFGVPASTTFNESHVSPEVGTQFCPMTLVPALSRMFAHTVLFGHDCPELQSAPQNPVLTLPRQKFFVPPHSLLNVHGPQNGTTGTGPASIVPVPASGTLPVQTPALHDWGYVHFEHIAPPVPHSSVDKPGRQTPASVQQVAQLC